MDEAQILRTILTLSESQGYYGRLYHQLMVWKRNYPEEYESFMDTLVSQEFSSPLGLVQYFEGG